MTRDSILKDATDRELGLAVFENLYGLFRSMANHLPEGKLIERETFSRHLTFPTNPMFKGVWKTQLSEAEADAAIDDTIAWFKKAECTILLLVDRLGTPPLAIWKDGLPRGV